MYSKSRVLHGHVDKRKKAQAKRQAAMAARAARIIFSNHLSEHGDMMYYIKNITDVVVNNMSQRAREREEETETDEDMMES